MNKDNYFNVYFSLSDFMGQTNTKKHEIKIYKVESTSLDELDTIDDLFKWIELNMVIYIKEQLSDAKKYILNTGLNDEDIKNNLCAQIEIYSNINTKEIENISFGLSCIGDKGDVVIPLKTPISYNDKKDPFKGIEAKNKIKNVLEGEICLKK